MLMSDVSLNFVLAKFNNYSFFIPLSFKKTDFFFFFWYYRECGGWGRERNSPNESCPNARRSDSSPDWVQGTPRWLFSRAQHLTITYAGASV